MTVQSFADEFLAELARCRELLAQYRQIGPVGSFGAAVIEDTLRRADVAVLGGDTVAMLRIYQELKALE